MAREEGIFCEPASSASLAGLLKLHDLDVDLTEKTIVCVLTGNGLKDPGTAEKRALVELEYVEPDVASVMNLLSSGK